MFLLSSICIGRAWLVLRNKEAILNKSKLVSFSRIKKKKTRFFWTFFWVVIRQFKHIHTLSPREKDNLNNAVIRYSHMATLLLCGVASLWSRMSLEIFMIINFSLEVHREKKVVADRVGTLPIFLITFTKRTIASSRLKFLMKNFIRFANTFCYEYNLLVDQYDR